MYGDLIRVEEGAGGGVPLEGAGVAGAALLAGQHDVGPGLPRGAPGGGGLHLRETASKHLEVCAAPGSQLLRQSNLGFRASLAGNKWLLILPSFEALEGHGLND